ncbi:exonuclease domain-containing protein [Caldilinea sp.]|uniref:exonuclease domain-containing protein n=1 Tax=Caldilinea sp. TaxID=2293560 RepID=UPI0021DBB66D|nr:exonuclease domain-containing protein [Caldilinea sp.]GIV70413.1 MAG: DNA polymerase III subunit epsilon [Caldilinea sp.]
MKRSQISKLVGVVALTALATGLGAGWLLAQAAQQNGALLWLGVAVVLAALIIAAATVQRFVRAFVWDVRRLIDAGRLMLTVHPEHRVQPGGPPDVQEMAALLNQFAERLDQLQKERVEAARQARADVEQERAMLATLLAELTEGVLVCNLDGQILLYNRSARRLLDGSPGDAAQPFVGLGRSVFGVIDRNAIVHALEQVHSLLQRRNPDEQTVMTSFVTAAANGRLLRTRLAPLLEADGSLRGYILTLQDVGEGIERSLRRDALLQTLTERQRASLGAIRAAIEAMESYPDMTPAQRQRFQQVILDEAQQLSEQIDEVLRGHASDLRAQWMLEEIAAPDLLWAVQRRLAERLGVEVLPGAVDDALRLKTDNYTLMQGLSHLAHTLSQDFGVRSLTLSLQGVESFAAIDIEWPCRGVAMERWQRWKEGAFVADDRDGVVTLREVAERHGGEVWFQVRPSGESAYFRLLLPRAADAAPAASAPAKPFMAPAVESRPEYYDFDLFHQPGQHPELDRRPLRSLTYTVLDAETTGLTPGLDEIVSIGALRIVNGRLLRQEVFEQLVDPRRPIPAAATAIHGITDAMVKGQPTIEVVLPRLHKFVEDTVLVGHNLAFDLRMFKEKEAESGVCFVNPVLDTLLLSAVIHPEEERHGLEDIARRLGVQVLGRHTALGDAILAGEIFLRMIPLLEERGIYTLQQARTAAEQTYFARLEY